MGLISTKRVSLISQEYVDTEHMGNHKVLRSKLRLLRNNTNYYSVQEHWLPGFLAPPLTTCWIWAVSFKHSLPSHLAF